MQLGEGAPPFRIVPAIEQQCLIGWNGQPGILLNFLVELARSPAGIAQGEDALARAATLGDDLQQVETCGQCHAGINL